MLVRNEIFNMFSKSVGGRIYFRKLSQCSNRYLVSFTCNYSIIGVLSDSVPNNTVHTIGIKDFCVLRNATEKCQSRLRLESQSSPVRTCVGGRRMKASSAGLRSLLRFTAACRRLNRLLTVPYSSDNNFGDWRHSHYRRKHKDYTISVQGKRGDKLNNVTYPFPRILGCQI